MKVGGDLINVFKMAKEFLELGESRIRACVNERQGITKLLLRNISTFKAFQVFGFLLKMLIGARSVLN